MPTPDDQPATSMALPLIRGFPCPVQTPFFGAGSGPPQGIGCGWQNMGGKGPQFYIVMHAEGGFAMAAQMDYARWRRFAENWASIGKQAMLTGDLDGQGPNDPLEALQAAHEAMRRARHSFHERKMNSNAAALDEPITLAAKALMIEENP